MRWLPVAFVADSVFIVTHAGFELTAPTLWVRTLNHYSMTQLKMLSCRNELILTENLRFIYGYLRAHADKVGILRLKSARFLVENRNRRGRHVKTTCSSSSPNKVGAWYLAFAKLGVKYATQFLLVT